MAAPVGTNRAGVSGNVRAPIKAEKENVGEGVPSSRTEKPKELSSLTPLGEASFKQGILVLRQELQSSRMFQQAHQQAQGTGSTPICKEFLSYVSAENLSAFCVSFRCLPVFRGLLLGPACVAGTLKCQLWKKTPTLRWPGRKRLWKLTQLAWNIISELCELGKVS